MKLKHLPNKESFENYSLRLRESQAKTLEQYHKFANQQTGVEMSVSELLTAMVTSFMEDDREFQVSLKPASAKPRPRQAAPTSTSSTF